MAGLDGLAMYSVNSEDTADDLVNRYAPLVKRIAQHLLGRMPASVQLDDLVQSGLIGLLEASVNYDSSKGASFETYAGIRIRGSMIDEVRKGDWAPRSVHRNSRRITDAMKSVASRLGQDASDLQVAEELGVGIEEYHAMANDSATTRLFSYDEITANDDDSSGDQIPASTENPMHDTAAASMRKQLAEEIKRLPERERLVLSLYYDEELNLKEIGLVLGVSESRVSQIHSHAALKLRSRLGGWAG
jgi:RNA polymerase sigma factor for flagellar operon FliA